MCIRLFLAAKRGEIVPIIAKEKIIWPPNGPKIALITPEWPPKAPPSTVCWWPVQQYIIWGYLGHFGQEKGVKSVLKWLQEFAFGPPNGLKFALNGPKMTPKCPQQYSIVVVSTTVYYLGAFRSFWGEERGETRSKLLIFITDIAWFFNFEQP